MNRFSQGISTNEAPAARNGVQILNPDTLRRGPQQIPTIASLDLQPARDGVQRPLPSECCATKVLQKLIHIAEGFKFDTSVDQFCSRNVSLHRWLIKDVKAKCTEIETFFKSLSTITSITEIKWETYESCTSAISSIEMIFFKLVNEFDVSVKSTGSLADKYTECADQNIRNGTLIFTALKSLLEITIKGSSTTSIVEIDEVTREDTSILKTLYESFSAHFTEERVKSERKAELLSSLESIKRTLSKRQQTVDFEALSQCYKTLICMQMMISEATQNTEQLTQTEKTHRESLVSEKVIEKMTSVIETTEKTLTGKTVVSDFKNVCADFTDTVKSEEKLPFKLPDMTPVLQLLGCVEEPYVSRSRALTTVCYQLIQLCMVNIDTAEANVTIVEQVIQVCIKALKEGGKPVDSTKPGKDEGVIKTYDEAVTLASECYAKLESIAKDAATFDPKVIYSKAIQCEKELLEQWHKRLDIDPNFCSC